MQTSIPNNVKTLERLFANRGIPTAEIGFYNHPNFLEAERKAPTFLEFYGAWVRLRPRDAAYEARVREVVPRIAQIVADEIESDGQLGVCIDASLMITKILEKEGVWCYAVRGALAIMAPSLNCPTHFWTFDTEPAAGHVWVVAPPFEIIDVALRCQPYEHGEAAVLPKMIIVEAAKRITPTTIDFCSSALVAQMISQGIAPHEILERIAPGLARVTTFFPSFEIKGDGDLVLHYSMAGITMSDGESLYAIKSRRWNGRRAGELYDQVVCPALRPSPEPS